MVNRPHHDRDPRVRSFSEFRTLGLLWLINASVFHPRGFAISFVNDPATGEVTGWRLEGDGGEAWFFEPDPRIDDLFERSSELLGRPQKD